MTNLSHSVDHDLASALTASGGDLSLAIRDSLERRHLRRDKHPLGDFEPTASWVRICFKRAQVTIDCEALPGQPNRTADAHGTHTIAQIDVAEAWTTWPSATCLPVDPHTV